MSDLEQLLDVQAHDTRADQLRHQRETLPSARCWPSTRRPWPSSTRRIAEVQGAATAAGVSRSASRTRSRRSRRRPLASTTPSTDRARSPHPRRRRR
ncbi:MAG: hypothetical protein U5R31_13620 [Acidimicrobiia bacterium]|nr:hypothetical protein [Acidimicrobiia bacterium]